MSRRFRVAIPALLVTILGGAETAEHPFLGITSIVRTETVPRRLTMHVVLIDLTAHGIRFKLTPPGGSLEAVRQTTLSFLSQQHAQVAINAHFFMPFPSTDTAANLIGLAASDGSVYSGFESPEQNYALVPFAPAINIDRSNHASVVHYDGHYSDGRHVLEHVQLWTAVAGSAQIVTNGVKTVPSYRDAQHPDGTLQEGGTRTSHFSNSDSWYERLQARTAIGLTQDEKTLVLFTVDRAAGSQGMRLSEVADVLIDDYKVYNALNLDGGGSTTMVMENPATHKGALFNTSSDNANGRSVGSNLAVFAEPTPSPQ
jgi:exopolysaccharide biosynthesis protein